MTATWSVEAAVEHLKSKAQAASTGFCARYTYEAIAAGGVTITPKESAKDFGPSLIGGGFVALGSSEQTYVAGDVVIIQPAPGRPHGHMAMYDGERWISDFVQRSLYPGSAYRNAKPAYKVYRHQ